MSSMNVNIIHSNSVEVNKKKRFSSSFRCPVCGGYPDLPRGQGERCHGFISADGKWAHCSREELAGGLPINPNSNTYTHLMNGNCKCGRTHGPAIETRKKHHSKPNRKIEAVYDYRGESGELIFQVVRYEPKDFSQRRPDGKGGWIWNLKSIKVVLYRYPELLKADPCQPVFITEGEKDCDRVRSLDLVATTCPMGAEKWQLVESIAKEALTGRHVIITEDNNAAGRKHVEMVASSLHGVAAGIKVIRFRDQREKYDISDWLDEGHNKEDLLKLIEETPEWQPAEKIEVKNESRDSKKKKTTVDIIFDILDEKKVELTHDGEKAYATIQIENHKECYPIKSSGFRKWIRYEYFQCCKTAPNNEALKNTTETIEAIAIHEGKSEKVYHRYGYYNDNIYIDIIDDKWRVIQVTAAGWKVIDQSPIKFRRTPKCQALPYPQPGTVSDFKKFINIVEENDIVLLIAFMLSAMRPEGNYPYPILCITGEHGSAKSTTAKFIKMLIDPNEAISRSCPREERDLMVAANLNWLLSFENISQIPDWLSDALCRLSTGAGFGKRTNYTDDEETVFSHKRPIVLNGIGQLIARPDLLDRTINIQLKPIPDESRKTENEILNEFNLVKPSLLGALLDGLSSALKYYQNVNLSGRPRMADFAVFSVAAEEGLGLKPGTFIEIYNSNRNNVIESTISQVPFICAICEFMEDKTEWIGTSTELLNELEQFESVTERIKKDSKQWPQAPNALTRRLPNYLPFLRQVGIEIEKQRVNNSSRTRQLIITRHNKKRENTVHAVHSVHRDSQSIENKELNDRTIFVNDIDETDQISSVNKNISSITQVKKNQVDTELVDDKDNMDDTLQSFSKDSEDRETFTL